jgi:hypothetical protein
MNIDVVGELKYDYSWNPTGLHLETLNLCYSQLRSSQDDSQDTHLVMDS